MHRIRRPVLLPALLPALLLGAAAAQACGPRAEVQFAEGAPDSFTIVNRSPPGWHIEDVRIDLRGALGGLYFDPTESGPGVSMADPLQPRGGGAVLAGASAVGDGDTGLLLRFDGFPAGARYAFTIDVDDSGGGMLQSVIEPGEFAGASLAVRFAAGPDRASGEARFDGSGRAETLDGSACS